MASPSCVCARNGSDSFVVPFKDVLEYGNANFAFVSFTAAAGALFYGEGYGDSYFRDAPSVASGVVLTLCDDLDPGTPGRPRVSLGHHFWGVPPGYPELKPAQ